MEISQQSVCSLLEALRTRQLSIQELLAYYQARVKKYNAKLNALVCTDFAAADKAAHGCAEQFLHGLPMTVKDSIEVAGFTATAGITALAEHRPAQHAKAVQQLVDAGAVIFGKSNTSAYVGDIQTYNPLFGVTHNPWDQRYSPGGSSGGAACAVAAGLTSWELGSDLAGSVRIPAHACGIYGHKPSYGLVPYDGHISGRLQAAAPVDMAAMGPLARSADDLELMMNLLVGTAPDMNVATKVKLPRPRHKTLRAFRVALWLGDEDFSVDAEVNAVLVGAVEKLARAGLKIDARARPGFSLSEAFDVYQRLLWPLTTSTLPPRVFDEIKKMAAAGGGEGTEDVRRFRCYAAALHREWLEANERRAQMRLNWRDFFREYDVLLCPVSPVAAIMHDHSKDLMARTISINGQQRWYWEQLRWVSLASAAYLPATVMPVGQTATQLPVGMQVIGPCMEDLTPITFAKCAASVLGGFVPPPL